MNRLLRQFVKHRNTQSGEVEFQHQPEGHLHPNYRHMGWFRPTETNGASIRR
ncbi:hypothetical protein [Chroococcidiopsis sp. TS-821]|uniref:hypothetical protein n=1 Tax=Chroococcidiopsis sp. TS-821 TaxID=1378066 RepID=UPI00143D7A6A|nr:hypothetical protein [Chroococcidiopsis sp. TS-821]